jgi:hypothetical protein
MSSHYRTWHTHHVGQLQITVALEPATPDLNVESHRRLGDFAKRLVDLFTAERLWATWAVGAPGRSKVCAAVIRAAAEHEIAILGDAEWLGPEAGRTRFARELAARITQARCAGISVTSLVTPLLPPQAHIDLVVKYGISAVAGGQHEKRPAHREAIPQALHYGVWQLPASARMPTAGSWWFSGRRLLMRRIGSAAKNAATFHLVIDAPALERASNGNVRNLARITRRIAEFRDRGLLQVETLAQAAARLTSVPAVTPQRSILRQAA